MFTQTVPNTISWATELREYSTANIQRFCLGEHDSLRSQTYISSLSAEMDGIIDVSFNFTE